MTKKGPLSKAEKFFIEHKYKDYDSTEELSTILDRPQSSVQAHINKCKSSSITSPIPSAGSQFASRKGIAMMTETASTMSDEIKRKRVNHNNQNYIVPTKKE